MRFLHCVGETTAVPEVGDRKTSTPDKRTATESQGAGIAPIPGTKRVDRVEENVAADHIELTTEQLGKLNNLTPAAGDHHNEAQMKTLDG